MLALSRDELNIGTEDDLFRIRRHVGKAARAQAFDLFATAAITTATAELARHVLLHARPGTATVEVISDGDRNGLRVTLRGQTGPCLLYTSDAADE